MDYCTTPDADFWLRVEDALRRLDDNTLDECATAALAAFHSHPSAAFTLIPLEEWASCSLHDILRCTFEATRRGTTQPEKQSHRYVAACIYACDMFGGTAGGTMACMAQLALFWTAYVYWPLWNNAGKRLATQPAPVYEPEAVFTRDGRRCVLTGNARPSLDELERKWGPIRFITAAPILPAYLPDFRKTKLFGFKRAFDAIRDFSGYDPATFDDLMINIKRPSNAITLECGANLSFHRFEWGLSETETKNTYRVFRSSAANIALSPNFDSVTFEPGEHAPNVRLLRLHETVAHILYPSGLLWVFAKVNASRTPEGIPEGSPESILHVFAEAQRKQQLEWQAHFSDVTNR